jgi:hypothetical protein
MAITQYLAGAAGTTQSFPTDATTANLFIIGIDEGRWVAPIVRHHFPGIAGARHYVDYRKEREIRVDVQLYGYASLANLNAGHVAIEGYTHNLVGNLSLDGIVYQRCTFTGVEPIGRRHADPHQGWCRKLRLFWAQRAYA